MVVLLESSRRVLLVKRKFAPFKGCLAVPGGFLRPLLEDLPTCAARELAEETGIRLGAEQMQLVSVRSNPNRDRRGHVIDSGYLAVILPAQEKAVLSALCAGDDAEEAAFIPIDLALKLPLAADHGSLLADAIKVFQSRKAQELPSIKTLLGSITRRLAAANRARAMFARAEKS